LIFLSTDNLFLESDTHTFIINYVYDLEAACFIKKRQKMVLPTNLKHVVSEAELNQILKDRKNYRKNIRMWNFAICYLTILKHV